MIRTYDAATGLAFLISQLSYIESKMYEKIYKKITYTDLLPVSNEAGEWAEAIDYFYMDGYATAKFVGSKSLDVPISEIGFAKETVPVELGATGYEYSDEELRQAIQLGRPLPQNKANTARRAYEELCQSVAMVGDTTHALLGFINNANVTSGTVAADGTSSSTLWSAKTPALILRDINKACSDVNVNSLQSEQVDTLVLPTAQWNYISSTPRSDNSDTTIKQYVIQNSPFLKSEDSIKSCYELTGAGAGPTDRMMAYTKDMDKVVFHIPMPLRFSEPQRKGRGFEIPGEFKVSGVEFRYPGSAIYADGI